MTADELRDAEALHQQASQHANQARVHRNTTIQTALEAGWTHAQISQATGLTRGRIGQLAQHIATTQKGS